MPLNLNIIGGAPRSGTTLLQAVLSQARGAAPLLGEARFLKHLLGFCREVHNTWDDDSHYYFSSRADAIRIAQAATDKLFDELAVRYNATSVAVKSPELTQWPEELHMILPTARKYVVLRDPRDVMALQWAATERELNGGFSPTMVDEELLKVVDPADERGVVPELSFEIVRALTEKFLSYYPLELLSDWTRVSYESLVRTPSETVAYLERQSSLALDYDPATEWKNVEFDFLRESQSAEGAWHSEHWGRPMTQERIGVHRETLSLKHAKWIQERCSDYLTEWEDSQILSANY